MNQPSPSDFSSVVNDKHITYFFRGHEVYKNFSFFSVSKAIEGTIDNLSHGQGSYHALRRIREVIENRKFPIIYHSFDEYVADWPAAEPLRHWITDIKSQVTIFQCDDESITLPGGYLWLYIVQYKKIVLSDKTSTENDECGNVCSKHVYTFTEKTSIHDCYNVRVCENDDRGDVCSKSVYTFTEAEKLVSNIVAKAPINMQTLINTMEFKLE